MDMANGHLDRIACMAQSNSHKVQWHHLLMEGLVGQQQVLLSKLVMMLSAEGSGEVNEVIEDQEEPQELQEEELGGQDNETEGAPGEGLGGALEDELGNGSGAEDGAGEENPQEKTQGKGKERAI
ncbi:hypothetical protein ID866_12381 [Astraeus odoratus]|nr:hypothetical protein ID866_12381 [Astraeus odoratus]